MRLKRFSLNVTLCACIDLSSARTSFAVAAVLKKHQSLLITQRIKRTNSCAMTAMIISYLLQRNKTKHYYNRDKFVLKKRFIKIIILRYKVIDNLSIYKTLYNLFFRRNYYVKLILRYFICLRLNKLTLLVLLKLLYTISSQISELRSRDI